MSIEKILKNLKIIVPSLAVTLYSCGSIRTSDMIKAGARAAGTAGLADTVGEAGALTGIESLADSSSENYRAQASAPVVNVNPQTQASSTQVNDPYDWEHILMDPRVTDIDWYGNMAVFSLPFIIDFREDKRYSAEVYVIKVRDLFIYQEGKNVKRITFTEYINEVNPKLINNGTKVSYYAQHINLQDWTACKEIMQEKRESFCEKHSVFFKKQLEKELDLRLD